MPIRIHEDWEAQLCRKTIGRQHHTSFTKPLKIKTIQIALHNIRINDQFNKAFALFKRLDEFRKLRVECNFTSNSPVSNLL